MRKSRSGHCIGIQPIKSMAVVAKLAAAPDCGSGERKFIAGSSPVDRPMVLKCYGSISPCLGDGTGSTPVRIA